MEVRIDDAIDSILKGQGILFAGSGYSVGAKNLRGESPRIGYEFANFLYEECNIPEGQRNGDLRLASQIYIKRYGEFKLIDLLKKEFMIIDVSEDHAFMASLPWRRVYTTNYDNVIELSFNKNRIPMTGVTLKDKINQYKDKRLLCVHLNGAIDRLTPSALRDEFKLTNSSYQNTDGFLDSAWIQLFRNDIRSGSAVFFIGFSCSNDLDISRVIVAHAERKKVYFIVRENESEVNLMAMEGLGTVLRIGLNGIAELIRVRRESFIPNIAEPFSPKSFSRYDASEFSIPTIEDRCLIDLLLLGDLKSDLLHYSMMDFSKYPYYIKREDLGEVVEAIESGTRKVVLHADLGNGKTLFLQGLMDELSQKGFVVFKFERETPDLDRELEEICRMSKAVLVVEGYSKYTDRERGLLARIKTHLTDDLVVVVTERTILNDTYCQTLENRLFDKEYMSKNLNRLSVQEVETLIKLTSAHGLWGEKANWPLSRKVSEFTSEYHSCFRLFLLSVLDSPEIKQRFQTMLKEIKDAGDSFFRATLLILCSNLFDFDLTMDGLMELLDEDLLDNPSFRNNSRLKEIIDFSGDYKIRVKSSIFSEALITRSDYLEDVVDLLIMVVKKLDGQLYSMDADVIIRKMISFSLLQRVFNLSRENKKNSKLVFRFLGEVKETEYARSNPHFWLQYAIAQLSARDYKLAKMYFDTAYSFAQKRENFDAYQIDNHFARYLLENEVEVDDSETCMEAFREAHSILSRANDPNENKHYPIRVAILYGDFYNRFYRVLSQDDRSFFLRACGEIIERIERYKVWAKRNQRTFHSSVRKCESVLRRILSQERETV